MPLWLIAWLLWVGTFILGVVVGLCEARYGRAKALVRMGLCGNREDHQPHLVTGSSLGAYWCTADQSTRLPYAWRRGNERQA